MSVFVVTDSRGLSALITVNKRRAPRGMSDRALQHALATRALARLSYQDLLDHTSDPFGDYAAGHYERLAKAELHSVGLK